jgi:hypothetical protein
MNVGDEDVGSHDGHDVYESPHDDESVGFKDSTALVSTNLVIACDSPKIEKVTYNNGQRMGKCHHCSQT